MLVNMVNEETLATRAGQVFLDDRPGDRDKNHTGKNQTKPCDE